MNLGRKGMVATVDAMIFIAVLGLTVSAVFFHFSAEDGAPSAADVHDDLFATGLRVSDVFDVKDFRIMPIQELLAIHLISGKGDISAYISEVLRAMVPVSHGFMFECIFGNNSVSISERTGDIRSVCERNTDTAAGPMFSRLTIY